MHGHSHDSGMATVSGRTRESTSRRPPQRPASSRPLVASSPQHGQCLAHPAQSSAGQGQRPCGPKANMEGIRSSGHGHPGQQEAVRQEERLVAMGAESHDRGLSLHPEAEAAMVARSAPRGPVSTENVLLLLDYQQYRCALTGRRLTPQDAALDHVVPIRFGGEHTIENAQVLHKDVNRAKGSLTSEEFIGMCREVVARSDSVAKQEDSQ